MGQDNRLGDFLRARREAVAPERVGLRVTGRRRVNGLRREEVALLAGVSLDYYVRLEQGRDRRPSAEILDALAQVLGLDEAARRHLDALARPEPSARRSRPRPQRIAPSLHALLDRWHGTPALVVGPCFDVLACNSLAAALYDGVAVGDNLVRALFLEPVLRQRYVDWDRVADDTVASLRTSADVDRDRVRLTEIVGELSIASEEFRKRWARHDVREKTSGTKRFHHPATGEFELAYETFAVNGSAGQMLVAYHAAPGSAAEQALARLADTATARAHPTARSSER